MMCVLRFRCGGLFSLRGSYSVTRENNYGHQANVCQLRETMIGRGFHPDKVRVVAVGDSPLVATDEFMGKLINDPNASDVYRQCDMALRGPDVHPQRVEQMLNDTLKKVNEGDHVIFYVSSHGGGKTQTVHDIVFPHEYVYASTILSWLENLSSTKAKILYVQDTCSSGAFVGEMLKRGLPKNIAVAASTVSDCEARKLFCQNDPVGLDNKKQGKPVTDGCLGELFTWSLQQNLRAKANLSNWSLHDLFVATNKTMSELQDKRNVSYPDGHKQAVTLGGDFNQSVDDFWGTPSAVHRASDVGKTAPVSYTVRFEPFGNNMRDVTINTDDSKCLAYFANGSVTKQPFDADLETNAFALGNEMLCVLVFDINVPGGAPTLWSVLRVTSESGRLTVSCFNKYGDQFPGPGKPVYAVCPIEADYTSTTSDVRIALSINQNQYGVTKVFNNGSKIPKVPPFPRPRCAFKDCVLGCAKGCMYNESNCTIPLQVGSCNASSPLLRKCIHVCQQFYNITG